MTLRRTLVTAGRVLRQLRHDHRTLGLIIGVPVVLMTILKYVFDKQPLVFDSVAPVILGIIPLQIMFLVASIATLRERTSGTLDRLMTGPMAKMDLIFGYALAFSLVGLVQAAVAAGATVYLLGVDVQGGVGPVLVAATAAAFLGTALGLFVSAFARNEFQAVQLVMPIIMPQLLLCGLFVPRDRMADILQHVSDVLPLTYSVDAMRQVAQHTEWTGDLTRDLAVVVGIGIAALLLGAATIRRRE